MFVKNPRIYITAVKQEQFPKTNVPEVVFTGKSNVGKSSIINMLVGRKALARVGSAPGKTRQINFYDLDEKLFFVDLPGYGYAKVSQSESQKWGKMVESYISGRQQIVLMVFIIDIRHKPGKNDITMHDWLIYNKLPYIIAASKMDKIKNSELENRIKDIRETLDVNEDIKIIPYSASKKIGKEELWEAIEMLLPYNDFIV